MFTISRNSLFLGLLYRGLSVWWILNNLFSLHSICQQRYHVPRFMLIFQIKLLLKIRYLDHNFCKLFSKSETYGRKSILIVFVVVVFQELAFFKFTDTYQKGSSSIFFLENVFSNLLLTSKNNIEIQFHRLSFAATIIKKFHIGTYVRCIGSLIEKKNYT